MTRTVRLLGLLLCFVALLPSSSFAEARKPNIVMIMGDDGGCARGRTACGLRYEAGLEDHLPA